MRCAARIVAHARLFAQCGDCFLLPFITYVCSNFLLVAVASFLVAFIEPLAAGSGIPEIKVRARSFRPGSAFADPRHSSSAT